MAKIYSADLPMLRNPGSVVNSNNVCVGKSITITYHNAPHITLISIALITMKKRVMLLHAVSSASFFFPAPRRLATRDELPTAIPAL